MFTSEEGLEVPFQVKPLIVKYGIAKDMRILLQLTIKDLIYYLLIEMVIALLIMMNDLGVLLI